MQFNFNTTPAQFLAWLRDSAIKGGMPPQFINCVDRLGDVEDLEADLERAGEETAVAEEKADDLLEELKALVSTLQNNGAEEYPESVEKAIKVAEDAIERHSK